MSVQSVPPSESSVLQTCWVWFSVDGEDITKKRNGCQQPMIDEGEEGAKWEQCLCKRESNCLTLFMESGAVHYVPLPFLVIHSHMPCRVHHRNWKGLGRGVVYLWEEMMLETV